MRAGFVLVFAERFKLSFEIRARPEGHVIQELSTNRTDVSEHAADRRTIQRARVDCDADNPARVLIHDDHHPVRL